MSTLTLDEPARIESSLAAGDVVVLTKGGKKLGTIFPATINARQVPLPDFRARLRVAWGSRVFSPAEIEAMRRAELDHERA